MNTSHSVAAPLGGKIIAFPHLPTTRLQRANTRPGGLTATQKTWLARGLEKAGGKLPLFDRDGQKIDHRTVRACLERGWAEPWFELPVSADWLICKLTPRGRAAVAAETGAVVRL